MALRRLSSIVMTAVVALVALFLYSRSHVLYTFYANAPSRLPHISNLPLGAIRFFDVLQNCEDVILNAEHGFALFSCDPSRDKWNTVMGTFIDPLSDAGTGIYAWKYASASEAVPEKVKLLDFRGRSEDFHPLGIEYHAPSGTLFVVNHASSGSCIEVFKYLPAENAATHIRTIKDPAIVTPNSIEILNDHEILVTNDHYFRRRFNPILALLETYLAIPGGNVVHVRWDEKFETKTTILAHLPFANGITRLNDTTLAISSSSTNSVHLYDIAQDLGSAPNLRQTHSIHLPFLPDNLSVDGDGVLLIAGHPHAPSLVQVAETNKFCHTSDPPERIKCASEQLSWVAEWSRERGLKNLLVGDEFGTSTTAVRDVRRGLVIVAGLYEDGIYVQKSH